MHEARRQQAEVLLSREGALLAEVAYRLGFRNMGAFFRAFRQWTGMTPRQYQAMAKTDRVETTSRIP